MKDEMKMVWDIQRVMKKESESNSLMHRIKWRLESELEAIKEFQAIQPSGWYALIKFKDGAPQCLGVFNPDKDDQPEPEWDLSISIPKPETVPEFQGW